MKSVAFHNLGCKVNSYEMDVMQQKLQEKGYKIVPFASKADIYIINTCTVTNIADRKSRQMLHRAKKQNPQAVVVAVGCYVQTGGERMLLDEGIDLAVGNNRKRDLPDILERFLACREGQAQKAENENVPATVWEKAQDHPKEGIKTLWGTTVPDIAREQCYEEMRLTRTAEHTRAYIKIQDGCNQFCSYCIIPYARGRVRSRKKEDILQEIRGLAAKGYREVVLTGIHISSYGLDFIQAEMRAAKAETGGKAGSASLAEVGEAAESASLAKAGETAGSASLPKGGEAAGSAQGTNTSEGSKNRDEADYLAAAGNAKEAAYRRGYLLELVEEIAGIEGIERIRLGSLEPRIITEEFAARLAAIPKVCPHFHLSLQSGCDATLKRMNRHYTTGEYYEKVRILRQHFFMPAVTTDVIVGFPGETEEEFEKTREFLEKIRLYEMHVFKYSRRQGTVADRLPDQLTEAVKAQRSDVLLALEKAQSREYREAWIGRRVTALLEEEKKIGGKPYLVGYTDTYVKAAVETKAGTSSGLEGANLLVEGTAAGFLEEDILLLKP